MYLTKTTPTNNDVIHTFLISDYNLVLIYFILLAGIHYSITHLTLISLPKHIL